MTMLDLTRLFAALKDSEENKKPCETVPYVRGEKKGNERAEGHYHCENRRMDWFSVKITVWNMAAEIY